MRKGVKAWGLIVVLVIFTSVCAVLVSADSSFDGKRTLSSNLIYVPDNYTTIQQAVNLATPGDTIIVRDGTYPENVDVYKTVTIQSENGSAKCIVEAANSNDHVFEVTADYVNIGGFTVTEATGNGRSGIYLNGVAHCNISNNNVSNNLVGIYLYSSSYNNLTNNTANDNSDCGIYLYESCNYNNITDNTANSNYYNGISVDWSSNNNITDNTANENGGGIYLHNSYNNTLTNNTASSNSYAGISLNYSSNNTLTNNNASLGYNIGILLSSSSNNTLTNNTASSNDYFGIMFENSSYNKLENNTADNNVGFGGEEDGTPPSTGIVILGSHNLLRNNTASNNFNGIAVFGMGPTGDIVSVNNTIEGNTVTNNTGIYFGNKPPSSGILIGASHSNTIRNNTVANNFLGICIFGILAAGDFVSHNNMIANNTINSNSAGILLQYSNNNTIMENTANENSGYGMYLSESSNNTLSGNAVISNNGTGIELNESRTNTVVCNEVNSNHVDGIFLGNSLNNTIMRNIVNENHDCGISLLSSGNNIITENNVSNNYNGGIPLSSCHNNLIYHNNLITNSWNAYDNTGTNSWDNGYPSGGNYWSEYTGMDSYNGPYQNIVGSDGIGDTPYNVSGDAGAQDRYPLMHPAAFFDTRPGSYPSISGTHSGTIRPYRDIAVSTLYTYPCAGTGGHTEYVKIWNSTDWNVTATWGGYIEGWHNLTFNNSFTLYANETCSYTIRTGSYPQIIHTPSWNATGGVITCTEFVDVNGRRHEDWIPAIRLY